MKQQNNHSYDQKKGSADQRVAGQKQGMPGDAIGRASMASDSGESIRDGNRRTGEANLRHGGPEGHSRERKSARNGSDSSES